jgi:hypothetical protein
VTVAYLLPEWGIWSDQHNTMVERSIQDLDEAKARAWVHFDAGDESVQVVESCPQHPDRQLSRLLLRDLVTCRRRVDGGIEHSKEVIQ